MRNMSSYGIIIIKGKINICHQFSCATVHGSHCTRFDAIKFSGEVVLEEISFILLGRKMEKNRIKIPESLERDKL